MRFLCLIFALANLWATNSFADPRLYTGEQLADESIRFMLNRPVRVMTSEGNWELMQPNQVMQFVRAGDRSFLVRNARGEYAWLPRNNPALNHLFPNCNDDEGPPLAGGSLRRQASDLGNISDEIGREMRRPRYGCGFLGLGRCNPARNPSGTGTGEPISPLDSCRISNNSGMRNRRHHDGCDMAVPNGTPLKAPMDGMILGFGTNGGYGRSQEMLWFPPGFNRQKFMQRIVGMNRDQILDYLRENPIITTINGRQYTNVRTYSAHLKGYENLRTGAMVNQGDVIGRTNNSGRSTGPHLHFEMHTDNPQPGCWNDRGIFGRGQTYKCDPRSVMEVCGKRLR
jgi:murein DD-endopeptidase MepM/ murein hydrolase activator NlpD